MSPNRLARTIKISVGVLSAAFLLFAATGLYLYRLSLTLPDLRADAVLSRTAETSIVYAADGSVLAEWHGEQDRRIVPLQDMPGFLLDAVVAIEDERFYEHNGVDARAVLRAVTGNARSEGIRQGGSTLTQQLVKLLFTDGERTIGRKVREMLLAYQLESEADKDSVLESYLNLVYFGRGAYGAQSAARAYFEKPVSELTLPESAMLAGFIHAPSRYNPADGPEVVKARRDAVLAKMAETGRISEAQRREAVATPVKVAPPSDIPVRAPHFVEWVKNELIEELGATAVYEGGLRVHTTLQPELQNAAEEAAERHLPGDEDPEIALVSLEHGSGRVVAMVGGRDFSSDQFNLAVQGRRQPGSAFKPFVLVAALQAGVRPDDVFSATPYTVPVEDGVWRVDNYENDKTADRMTLRAATNWSVNAVYARLIMKIGPEKVADTARKMGITSPVETNPAIALGGLSKGVSPLEMASAYGTIASRGVRTSPHGIERVTDAAGEVIYTPERKTERVVPEHVAMKASLMLHDVVETGTATEARMEEWSAGKTGTTQSYRDAWFVGYARDLSTAVWVGYREAQVDMTDVRGIAVTGGSFPARIWRSYMSSAIERAGRPVTPPVEDSAAGDDPVLVHVCSDSMLLANSNCPNTVGMYLERELIPGSVCEKH